MRYLLSVFFGFACSGIGVIPPGLLNMTALRISLSKGRPEAKMFVAGAILVIVSECYLSLLFARYLGRHPEVVMLLREVALVIFLLLATYFFFFAGNGFNEKAPKHKLPKKRNWFLLGAFFSALNFLTVPFYVGMSLTLASYKVFHFEQPDILLFLIGVLFGSAFGFWCFVTFFQRMETYTSGVMRHINRIIGTALLLVSLLTAINILQYYYE